MGVEPIATVLQTDPLAASVSAHAAPTSPLGAILRAARLKTISQYG